MDHVGNWYNALLFEFPVGIWLIPENWIIDELGLGADIPDPFVFVWVACAIISKSDDLVEPFLDIFLLYNIRTLKHIIHVAVQCMAA